MGPVLTQAVPWAEANQAQLARIEQQTREQFLVEGVVSLLRVAALPGVINLEPKDTARIRHVICNK